MTQHHRRTFIHLATLTAATVALPSPAAAAAKPDLAIAQWYGGDLRTNSQNNIQQGHYIHGMLNGKIAPVCRNGDEVGGAVRINNSSKFTCLGQEGGGLLLNPKEKGRTISWANFAGSRIPHDAVPFHRKSNHAILGTICLSRVGTNTLPGYIPLNKSKCRVKISGQAVELPAIKYLKYNQTITTKNEWRGFGNRRNKFHLMPVPVYAFSVTPGSFICRVRHDNNYAVGTLGIHNGFTRCHVYFPTTGLKWVSNFTLMVNNNPSKAGYVRWINRTAFMANPKEGAHDMGGGRAVCKAIFPGKGTALGYINDAKKCSTAHGDSVAYKMLAE